MMWHFRLHIQTFRNKRQQTILINIHKSQCDKCIQLGVRGWGQDGKRKDEAGEVGRRRGNITKETWYKALV